jgi:hypothetical protein
LSLDEDYKKSSKPRDISVKKFLSHGIDKKTVA